MTELEKGTVSSSDDRRKNGQMATREISVVIPEIAQFADKNDERAFARELLVLAAIKLNELGRFSSGQAAALAGMGRVEFLCALDRYNVFPFETELNDLELEHA